MITITEPASLQLRSFLIDQGTPDAGLRVFVAPGGCSGLQYGMTIEETHEDDDTIIEMHGVKVIVDAFSADYLSGSEIDYNKSLMGAGFTIHSPKAIAGCACGHSFTTGEDEATANGCGCG